MYKYPSIEQIRHVLKSLSLASSYVGKDKDGNPIYDVSKKKPVLTFNGTVKIHGTNAGIVFDPHGRVYFQSRERILTPESDNYGFASNMLMRSHSAVEFLQRHFKETDSDSTVCLYGEWCGPGIQSGVGVSKIPNKIFVIFGIRLIRNESDSWIFREFSANELSMLNSNDVYLITQFPTYSVTVDMNDSISIAEFQNDVVKLTDEVEKECPIAKYFGISGIGEGIVFSSTYEGNRYIFKSKGEKHSMSKVRTVTEVDVERLKEIEEFASSVVTEARLQQGLFVLKNEFLKPLNMTSLGNFIRWIYNDVLKEEYDLIEKYDIDQKKLGSIISKKVKSWYINNMTG